MSNEPDVSLLRSTAPALTGKVSGVYLLFDGEELVYIGEGWNCFLAAAEHTRKELKKSFTHWNFIPIESKSERRALKRRLLSQHSPRFNRA